jgi:hypothetical protein
MFIPPGHTLTGWGFLSLRVTWWGNKRVWDFPVPAVLVCELFGSEGNSQNTTESTTIRTTTKTIAMIKVLVKRPAATPTTDAIRQLGLADCFCGP